MIKLIIKEIVVVEGKEDTRRLKEVFKNINTIETRGSAIDKRTIELIKEAQKERGVIIFTDPDYQGQRIRSIINQHVNGCKNAYIDKAKAICVKKKKVGVEHCTNQDIIESLNNITMIDEIESDIKFIDLYNLNIIGGENSNDIREFISKKLHLGHNNAKQFYNKIKMFSISLQTLETLIEEFYKEVGDNNG
ncbi:MAG: Ribonuclease [Haloplasmataceae bacterium]|nr:Ribonuclease [Haloplasmataceae bacterium]